MTLRDLAHHTGFSTSTVSIALRGSKKLPVATRVKIQQAAKDLGYRINPMLAALSSHRWHQRSAPSGSTLALLVEGKLEGQKGIIERASTYGYQVEVFQVGDYPDPRRLSEILFNRGILGVGVGQIFTPGFCSAFDWSHFVAVAISEGHERPPINLVMPNHFQAMQVGWDHARALGYRRIGLALFETPTALDYHDRCAAFMERQQQVPPADRIPILAFKPRSCPATESPEAAEKAQRLENITYMGNWLQHHQPDVVLGFNSAILWLMRDAGWRIPKNAGFISLWIDDDPIGITATGLVLTSTEVGCRAIDWLDSLLRSGERGIPRHPATMSIDMIWQDGITAPGIKPRRHPTK